MLAVQKTGRNQSKLVVSVRGSEPRTLNKSKDHHSSTLRPHGASPAANCQRRDRPRLQRCPGGSSAKQIVVGDVMGEMLRDES